MALRYQTEPLPKVAIITPNTQGPRLESIIYQSDIRINLYDCFCFCFSEVYLKKRNVKKYEANKKSVENRIEKNAYPVKGNDIIIPIIVT